MLRLSLVRTAHELDRLHSKWQELAAQSPHATIFQSFEWNRLAAAMFADREAPWVIHAVSDSGEAIIPAVRRRDELSLIGETLFDYRDVLAVGAVEVLDAAFGRLAETHLPLTITAVRGHAADFWPESVLSSFAGAPCVRVEKCDAETFRRSHARLASRARRLPRNGFAFRRYDNPHESLVRDLYERKAQQSSAGQLFADPKRIDFMCNITNQPRTFSTVWCYEDDSESIATVIAFRNGDIQHFYTTWYNAELAVLSPGQALLFEAVAQTLAEGLNADFMTGESFYKARLATDVVPLFRVDARAQDVAHLASKRHCARTQPSVATEV